jgi:peptidoglycan hydrolase-like protein with peptidoglycan-binding domain
MLTQPSEKSSTTLNRLRPVQASLYRFPRLRFSPGPIDANVGANTRNALTAFQRAHAPPETGRPDKEVWDQLGEAAAEPALVEYTITPNDVAGPFVCVEEVRRVAP